MANRWYTKGINAFAKGEIDWVNDDIREVYVDGADYTPDTAADEFLDDIASGARVDTAALAGKTATGAGVLDATDTEHSTVTGDEFEYIVLYKHNADHEAAQLLILIDTATNLPTEPMEETITTVYAAGGIATL